MKIYCIIVHRWHILNTCIIAFYIFLLILMTPTQRLHGQVLHMEIVMYEYMAMINFILIEGMTMEIQELDHSSFTPHSDSNVT